MPPHDYKISKIAEDPSKRRPSIELSPTLEKPIYIVTKNMTGPHILYLVEVLEQQKIQYQLQQQTSTLGFLLNQRFFVIVDNKYGEVTLGAEFASLLMTIVGYPKIGKNKKNKYFQNPLDIVKYFKQFKASPDVKLSKSTFKSGQKDAIIEQPVSQMKSKIEVKSIIKYKSEDKSKISSHNSLKQACIKQFQKVKLIVLEDKSDKEYTSICENIFSFQKAKEYLQKAQNLQQVRKKTLFHTMKIPIYYLVNQKNAAELIKSIFIGEVIIFNKQQNLVKVKQMVDQPKIYAVSYQQNQLYKILHKIGINTIPINSTLTSKLSQSNTFTDSKNSPFLLKNESNVKAIDKGKAEPPKQKAVISQKPQIKQVSVIQNNNSVVSQYVGNETVDLNASIISKASSASRKIKRIKPKKKSKQKSQNKSNDAKLEISISNQRKKTLKTQYYQTLSRSKKNLTFKENLVENNRIKRVKSITKVQPQIYNLQSQSYATMTESDYYNLNTLNTPIKNYNTVSSGNFFSKSQNSFTGLDRTNIHRNGKINGVFYRQFVPKFHNIAQLIKLKPSIFFESQKNAYLQSFVYIKQYDRFVRRLKNQLKDKSQTFDELNLIVILREEDYSQFLQYCKIKNKSYDEEQTQLMSMMKESNFSYLGKSSIKTNLYMFIEGEATEEVITCGRIQIFKHKLLSGIEDFNLSKTISYVRDKILSHGLISIKQNPYG